MFSALSAGEFRVAVRKPVRGNMQHAMRLCEVPADQFTTSVPCSCSFRQQSLTVSNRSTANVWSCATPPSLSRCFLLCKKNVIHAMCTVCRSSEGSSTCCNPNRLDPGRASSILLFMNSTCAYCIQHYRLISKRYETMYGKYTKQNTIQYTKQYTKHNTKKHKNKTTHTKQHTKHNTKRWYTYLWVKQVVVEVTLHKHNSFVIIARHPSTAV